MICKHCGANTLCDPCRRSQVLQWLDIPRRREPTPEWKQRQPDGTMPWPSAGLPWGFNL